MEEKRVMIVYILVIFLLIFGIFFILDTRFTGFAVSNQLSECNVADFDENGEVDFQDKVVFNQLYEENVDKTNYCGRVDVNEDGMVNVVDSNRFSEIFEGNYGIYETPCIYKKLDCEIEEIKLDEGVVLDEEVDLNGKIVEDSIDVEDEKVSYKNLYIFIGIILIIIIAIIIYKKKK